MTFTLFGNFFSTIIISFFFFVLLFFLVNLVTSFLFKNFPNLILKKNEFKRNDYISRFDSELKHSLEEWFDLNASEWKEFKKEYQETELNVYKYDPFCEYGHSPKKGKFINYSSHGFRNSKEQGNWPPREDFFNIFFLVGQQL